MTRICILIILVVLGFRTSAQDPALPRVHIIGVVHSENRVRNADSLIQILKTLNPDLILVETDTVSGYFGSGYRLKTPAWWYKLAVKLRLARKIAPEMEAMYRYKSIEPTISLLPFDIAIPNRKKYLKTSTKAEYDLLVAINRINQKGQIPESLHVAHKEFTSYNNWLYDVRHLGYRPINQHSVTDSLRRLMSLEYNHFSSLFESIPELRKHEKPYKEERQFWDIRNQKMAENILSFVKSTGCKKVVVLTGLLHKYYLEDLLLASKEKFLLEKYFP